MGHEKCQIGPFDPIYRYLGYYLWSPMKNVLGM